MITTETATQDGSDGIYCRERNFNIPEDITLPQFMFDHNHPSQLHHPPHHPWLIDSVSGRMFSARELQDRIWAVVNALNVRFDLDNVVDPIVGIISANHVDYPLIVWASHRAGASVFVTNPAFKTEELLPQLREARPHVLFVHQESLSNVREACLGCDLSLDSIILFDPPNNAFCPRSTENPKTVEDLIQFGLKHEKCHQFKERKLCKGEGLKKMAFLFPSSGTTGIPKLIQLSHYAFIANVLQAVVHDAGSASNPIPFERRRHHPGDVTCAPLPFFHVLGLLINLHYQLFFGMTVVVVPKFHTQDFLRTIQEYSVTHLTLVPPMIVLFTKYLAPNARELRTVKVAYVGGAPLDNALVTRLSALIPNAVIGQMYGMTEGGAMTGPSLDTKIPALSAPESGIRSASVGKMFPGNEWKVIKIDGSLARRGEKGELWVRTPAMASGYRNNVDASSDTFVDGWLRTGDEVFFDQNDEMFHVQRLKDFMKVKGFRVNPIEIEGHLLEHPDILDCCVVPVPDEFSYELPKAFVVLTEEAKEKLRVVRSGSNDGQAAEDALKDKLIQYVADHKIAYKHLAGGVEFCDEIPKTSSGKLLRRVLRDRPTEKVPT